MQEEIYYDNPRAFVIRYDDSSWRGTDYAIITDKMNQTTTGKAHQAQVIAAKKTASVHTMTRQQRRALARQEGESVHCR